MTPQSRKCPLCTRILIPRRDGTWPPHYADVIARVWCSRSGVVVAYA